MRSLPIWCCATARSSRSNRARLRCRRWRRAAARSSRVGTNQQMQRYIGSSTKVIDLAGRLAIPGFIEGHGHFTGLGSSKMMLNLRDAKNWDQIVAMVAAAAREAKPGTWILGRGWHQAKWDPPPSPNVQGFPLHDALSKVSPHNPVWLTHASGHAGFANAEAMRLAGVDKNTPNPPGGEILKDAQGNPTGLLNEQAQGLISHALDHLSSASAACGGRGGSAPAGGSGGARMLVQRHHHFSGCRLSAADCGFAEEHGGRKQAGTAAVGDAANQQRRFSRRTCANTT